MSESNGFVLIKSETLFLPRAQAVAAARAHQELPHGPTERELDPKRVANLIERIKAKHWLPCQWATVNFDGTKYRMNGQHSSSAMVEAAEELPDKVSLHLDHFDAATAEGMGMLFRQFDARISSRSKLDVSGAYQGLIRELASLSKKKVKLGIEGAAWFERAIEGLPVQSGDELYEKLLRPAYHPFLRWVNGILVHGKTRELEKVPVVASMYEMFLRSESGAQEFWSHVAKNDLADDSDPRSVLSRELTDAIDPEKAAARFKPVEFFAKCRKAWNAFRAGDKIRSLNVNTKKGLPELAA
jgi:hypothetical protein